MLFQMALILGIETLPATNIRKELIEDLSLVNFHLYEGLGLRRIKLIFLNRLNNVVDPCCSLLS